MLSGLVESPEALDVGLKMVLPYGLILDKDIILPLWVLGPNLEPWNKKSLVK